MTADEWLDDAYRLEERDKQIAALKALCARAADALEATNIWTVTPTKTALIAELRKAAE